MRKFVKSNKLFGQVSLGAFITGFLLLIFSQTVDATPYTFFQNEESGYCYIIEDDAKLLENTSDEDWHNLLSLLIEITNESNVALYTTDDNPYYSTDNLARYQNECFFGHGSDAVIFVIDMDNRNIYLDSMGKMRRYVTNAYANTITDNTYRYASNGDYYGCIYEAFSEVNSLLKGRRISQPMKYISNALLAIILAMLINYFVIRIMAARHKPSKQELFSGIYHDLKVFNPSSHFTNTTKTYSPQSSGGGGGHSGGGHGGSHSGGGHSGGGHHF